MNFKEYQKKAATTEVEQELPKNPQEYSYKGDEILEIPAKLFLLLYRANEKAIQEGVRREFPTATEWVSAATGLPVPNPKEVDIKAGLTTQVMSINKTFSQGNIQETFSEWLFPDVIQAKEELINIHNKAVESGIATKISDLQSQAREEAKARAEAAAKLEVVTEGAPEESKG